METRDEKLQQIALMMHSLHPEDRHWLVRELGDDQMGQLKPLLDELATLGIPSDKQIIESFFAEESTTSDSNMHHLGPASLMSKIDDFSAEGIFAVLCDETPEFIARVLEIRNWRWQTALLQLFDEQKANLIQACVKQHESNQEAMAQAVRFNDSLTRHLMDAIRKKQLNQPSTHFASSMAHLVREEAAEDVRTAELGFFARLKSKIYRSSSIY